jgi:hypothetical protein
MRLRELLCAFGVCTFVTSTPPLPERNTMAAPTASASPTQDAVVRNIKIQMTRVGLDGKTLADLLGKNKDWVYRRTNGQTDISIPDLELVAPHLHTSVAALVSGEVSA